MLYIGYFSSFSENSESVFLIFTSSNYGTETQELNDFPKSQSHSWLELKSEGDQPGSKVGF